jgi:hypothetical protein
MPYGSDGSGSATVILQNWPGPPSYQSSRSVTFWYRSGSGNPDLYHWVKDLDYGSLAAQGPALFFSGFLSFFAYYPVGTCTLYNSLQRLQVIKKSENCRNQGFYDGRIRSRFRKVEIIADLYPEDPKIYGSYASGSGTLLLSLTSHQIPTMNQKRSRNFKAFKFTSICDVPYGTCTL